MGMFRFDGVEPVDPTDHVLSLGQPTTMSKRMVYGGDAAGLPTRFSQIRNKARSRIRRCFPISSSVRPVSTVLDPHDSEGKCRMGRGDSALIATSRRRRTKKCRSQGRNLDPRVVRTSAPRLAAGQPNRRRLRTVSPRGANRQADPARRPMVKPPSNGIGICQVMRCRSYLGWRCPWKILSSWELAR